MIWYSRPPAWTARKPPGSTSFELIAAICEPWLARSRKGVSLERTHKNWQIRSSRNCLDWSTGAGRSFSSPLFSRAQFPEDLATNHSWRNVTSIVSGKAAGGSPIEREDGEEEKPLPTQIVSTPSVRSTSGAISATLPPCPKRLSRCAEPWDRKRLELYYARGKTLAEIGRLLREHESSASRHLERTRRELRAKVEECLRSGQLRLVCRR